jgi:hypothetical protein
VKNLQIANSIILLIIAFFLGFNFYQDDYRNQVVFRKIEADDSATFATLEGMEYEIDSINNKLNKLAEASLYLDSCQQVRITKTERAERRGKFVGGLLKALFPSL